MSKQVITQDTWDTETFQECVKAAPKMEQVMQNTQALETVAELAADVFASFYQPAPKHEDHIEATHFLNQKLIERFESSSAYHELRNQTVNDDLAATIATTTVTEKIIAHIPPDLIKQVEELQQIQEAIDSEEATNLEARINEAVEEVSSKARLAMESAKEEIATHQAIMTGFSLTGNGDELNKPIEEKIKIFESIKKNPKLQRVMQFAGRAIRMALATQRNKTIHPPTVTTGITLGNDLAQILPSELSYLADPETEDLFFVKFIEKSLLQWERIGFENVGQGPIIMGLDESGSMTDIVAAELGGITNLTREEWSKGIALALATIARKQKRDFAIVHYASTGQQKVTLFPKGEATIEQISDAIRHFFNGGTDFEPMMAKIEELIQGSTFDKADAIIISDGLTNIPPAAIAAWHKTKAERKFRSYGILIGTNQGFDLLKSICDETFKLTDIFTDEEAPLKTVFGI